MNAFQYEQFVKLTESNVFSYVEPFVADSRVPIPHEILQKILADLSTFDESHLVYAIELGPDRAPDLFAGVLPQLLTHPSRSVRLAASRALERLPADFISRQLIDDIEKSLSHCPEGEYFMTLLEVLQERKKGKLIA
jgi:hypothetical protein